MTTFSTVLTSRRYNFVYKILILGKRNVNCDGFTPCNGFKQLNYETD